MNENQSSHFADEQQTVQKIYAAINRNDVATAMTFFDPKVERVEPPDFPTAGTYRGIEEVATHLAQGRGTWAEGTCEPEQLIAIGDKVVVFLYVHVRLQNAKDWIEGRFADVLTFKNGKVIGWRSFGERQDAVDWAGV